MELALDEINAAGGVLGRKLEIVSRDDNGTPGDAVRVAEELLSREKAVMLMGTFPSNVGLAVADFAKQRKVPFLAAEPLTDKIVWESGNKYTYRLRASTFMQTAMLVPEAAKLGKKRWAIVYPNYEYGQSATAAFKKQLNVLQSGGLEFIEIAVPLGKIDPGPVVQALLDAQPDAIFSSLFGPDLARFVREGQLRGLFKDRPVFNLLGGEPEYLDPLKDEAPVGWYVTGYPWYAIETPEHVRFRNAYQARFNDYPRLGSVVGYSTVLAAAAAIRKANSTDPEKIVDGAVRPHVRLAVRQRDVPPDRPPIDDGRVRGPHRGQGRQGRDGRLALRRRQGLPARGFRRAFAASAAVGRRRALSWSSVPAPGRNDVGPPPAGNGFHGKIARMHPPGLTFPARAEPA